MKALDTNVLVRFLVKDDPAQARWAASYITQECTAASPGWINRIVLCELVWVLETAYKHPRRVVADVVEKVLRTEEFLVEDVEEAWGALRDYRVHGVDLADSLLGRTNFAAGCEITATFDKAASELDDFLLLTR